MGVFKQQSEPDFKWRRIMMRKSFPLIIVALACVQSFGQDKPKAYLRHDGSKYVVDVYPFREYKSATSQPIVAALYGDNQKLSNVVLKGSGFPGEGRFKILVAQSEAEIAKTEKYVVAVQSYADAAGEEGWSIPVGFGLAAEMSDVGLEPGSVVE